MASGAASSGAGALGAGVRGRLRSLAAARPLALAREHALLLAMTGAAGLLYSAAALLDHAHLSTSTFDLGIYDQAVWHYSRFEAPASTLTLQPDVLSSQLADHFSPILALLAPLYWIWSDPSMLLIAQGLLIAASAIPVFLFTERRLGRAAAYGLLVPYLGFWGIQSAVTTDFHEVAFAPLLIASAVLFADRRRWRLFFAALAVLLLVKEDMPLVVSFFGVWLIATGERRKGIATALAGPVLFVLVNDVLKPAFAGGAEPADHWTYDAIGANLGDALLNVLTDPLLLFETALGSGAKVETLVFLALVPFIGLMLLSPLSLVTIPLILERVLSSRPDLWATEAHYSLSIAPLLALGAADGLARLLRWTGNAHRARAAGVAAGVAMTALALVAAPDGHRLGRLVDPGYWSLSDREEAAHRAVSQVPSHLGSVAADGNLVPQLSARERVYRLLPDLHVRPAFLVYDARDPASRASVTRIGGRYRQVFSELGYTVLERRRPPGSIGPGGS